MSSASSGSDQNALLKTLQELERERERARQKTWLLVAFFSLVLMVLIGGFAFAGYCMFNNMSSVQTRLVDAALQSRDAEVERSRKLSEQATENTTREFVRATTEMQSSLGKKIDGMSETAVLVNQKITAQESELTRLRDELKRLTEQNGKLHGEIQTQKKESVPLAELERLRAELKQAETQKSKNQESDLNTLRAELKKIAEENGKLQGDLKTLRIAAAKPVVVTTMVVAASAPFSGRVLPAPSIAGVSGSNAAPAAVEIPLPPATKEPPVTPAQVQQPAAPAGLKSTDLPLQSKAGAIPWRVMTPE